MDGCCPSFPTLPILSLPLARICPPYRRASYATDTATAPTAMEEGKRRGRREAGAAPAAASSGAGTSPAAAPCGRERCPTLAQLAGVHPRLRAPPRHGHVRPRERPACHNSPVPSPSPPFRWPSTPERRISKRRPSVADPVCSAALPYHQQRDDVLLVRAHGLPMARPLMGSCSVRGRKLGGGKSVIVD